MDCRFTTISSTRRRGWVAAAAAALLGVCCAFGQEAARTPPAVTDARVEAAMQRGLAFLFQVQQKDGSWTTKYSPQHPGGAESLAVLAALSAGAALEHPGVAAAIKYIDRLDPQTVYVRAVRILVYAQLADRGYADRLKRDVDWLAKQQDRGGGWGYGPGHPTTQLRPRWTDASNSQLALLALASASAAGATAPPAVWQRSQVYWTRAQNGDGGWGYEPPGGSGAPLRGSSYGSMTAAGVASLMRLAERYAASEETPFHLTDAQAAKKTPLAEGLDRGRTWMAEHYSTEAIPGWVWGPGEEYLHYYYHCLARAAVDGGMRTVGGQDWWPQLAERLLATQAADGSWADARDKDRREDAVIRTAFAMLAMAEAKAPVLLNRLAIGADDEGLDALAATRWYSRAVTPVSWQKVDLATSPQVLDEAPILYVVLAESDLPDSAAAVFRDFVSRGGTVLVQPRWGQAPLVQFARDYFLRAFPDYHAAELSKDHPVYRARFLVPEDRRPGVLGVGDSIRTPVLILTDDVAGPWRQDRGKEYPGCFRLLGNLVAFATDSAPLVGKLGCRQRPPKPPPPPPPSPARWIPVARVKHTGDFDVCPKALARLSDVLAEAVSIGVRELPPVDLGTPVSPEIRLLWLTGTGAFELSPPQKQNLADYLRGGGMLLVDSAMGRDEFFDAAMATVEKLLPPSPPEAVPLSSPLLTGRFSGGLGSNVTAVSYTRSSPPSLQKGAAPHLLAVELNGRLAVVLSRYGLTCPMEGYPIYGCVGLQTDDALRLAANIVLYAATQATPP